MFGRILKLIFGNIAGRFFQVDEIKPEDIKTVLRDTVNKPFEFDDTIKDWKRADGDFIYFNERKVFENLPSDIKKERPAHLVERFFYELSKNKNLEPATVSYLRRFSHQNGYMKAFESWFSQYFMLARFIKIRGYKNRYDYIVNNDDSVTFIERFYIHEYTFANDMESKIKPEDENRPIAIGVAVSTIKFENGIIKHDLVCNKLVLTDKRLSNRIFIRNRFKFYVKKFLWYMRGKDFNDFPFVFFDDKNIYVHERYDEDDKTIEKELQKDIKLARQKGVASLENTFARETIFDKMARWVDNHPWQTVAIVLAVFTILATAITAAVVFAPATAAVPAVLALKLGKFVTAGAAAGFVAKIIGVIGIGTILGAMAAAGLWVGHQLENLYDKFFGINGSQTVNGDAGESHTGSDEEEMIREGQRACLRDIKNNRVFESDWKSIAIQSYSDNAALSGMTSSHFAQSDRDATNDVIGFIKMNKEFFSEPFINPDKFNSWVKNHKHKETSMIKYLTTLINPQGMAPSELLFRDAMLGATNQKDGLVDDNEKMMRFLLEDNIKLRSGILQHKNDLQNFINFWKQSYTNDHNLQKKRYKMG